MALLARDVDVVGAQAHRPARRRGPSTRPRPLARLGRARHPALRPLRRPHGGCQQSPVERRARQRRIRPPAPRRCPHARQLHRRQPLRPDLAQRPVR
eukprot:3793534-Prymnesium_polylepis.1